MQQHGHRDVVRQVGHDRGRGPRPDPTPTGASATITCSASARSGIRLATVPGSARPSRPSISTAITRCTTGSSRASASPVPARPPARCRPVDPGDGDDAPHRVGVGDELLPALLAWLQVQPAGQARTAEGSSRLSEGPACRCRPATDPSRPPTEAFADCDLLCPAVLVRHAGPPYARQVASRELQPAVVAVAGVDRPVAADSHWASRSHRCRRPRCGRGRAAEEVGFAFDSSLVPTSTSGTPAFWSWCRWSASWLMVLPLCRTTLYVRVRTP